MSSTAIMVSQLKQAIQLAIDSYQHNRHVSAVRAQDIMTLEEILTTHHDGSAIIDEIAQWILGVQTGLLGRSQLRDNIKAVIQRDEFNKTIFYRVRIAELEILAAKIPKEVPEISLIPDDPSLLKQELTITRKKVDELTALSEKQAKNIIALEMQNERLIEINHKLAQDHQKLKASGQDSILSSSPSDVLQHSFRRLSQDGFMAAD